MSSWRKVRPRERPEVEKPFICYFNGANKNLATNAAPETKPRRDSSRGKEKHPPKGVENALRSKSCWTKKPKEELKLLFEKHQKLEPIISPSPLRNSFMSRRKQMKRILQKIENFSSDEVALQLIESFSDSLAKSTPIDQPRLATSPPPKENASVVTNSAACSERLLGDSADFSTPVKAKDSLSALEETPNPAIKSSWLPPIKTVGKKNASSLFEHCLNSPFN